LRVLLVRTGALGDLLLLRRTIAALRQGGHTVTLLAPSGPAAALVGAGPGDVAQVLPWESAGFAGLLDDDGLEDGTAADRLRPHEAALVYSRSTVLTRNIGRLVPVVVKQDPQPPDAGPHAADWLASCLSAIGVPATDIVVPVLAASADDEGRADAVAASLPPGFLALHPGSGSPAKNWPAARFAELARSRGGGRWLLVRGPADDAAAAILETVPGACAAQDLPLRVLAALLARAGAYVGNDSGITHLAAASGAPTIALFAATDPRLWAPVGPHVEVIRRGTMDGIAVGEVAAVIDDLPKR
jgi:ADP-heptose:LPS heptosyltransferase